MTRRILTAREQVAMLALWRTFTAVNKKSSQHRVAAARWLDRDNDNREKWSGDLPVYRGMGFAYPDNPSHYPGYPNLGMYSHPSWSRISELLENDDPHNELGSLILNGLRKQRAGTFWTTNPDHALDFLEPEHDFHVLFTGKVPPSRLKPQQAFDREWFGDEEDEVHLYNNHPVTVTGIKAKSRDGRWKDVHIPSPVNMKA